MSQPFLAQYGPWAIVTGASSGIGQAFSELLAERGLNIIITARRSDRLDALATRLASQHRVDVLALSLDLSSPDFMAPLIAVAEGKDIGLIVSNAGFGLKGLHQDMAPERLDPMLQLNARAPMLISNYFAKPLIARGRGGIVFTGSMEGFMGFPYSASYAATKAFVHSLGESLWQELKPHGISVLTLAPGSTDTEALALQGFDSKEMVGLMSPRDVAERALGQLGKKRVYVAGRMNNFLIRLMSGLPRSWGLAMAEAGIKGALKKK